jgi:LysM repeat protein
MHAGPRRDSGQVAHSPKSLAGRCAAFGQFDHRGCMCTTAETTTSLTRARTVFRAGVAIAAAIAIVGTAAPASAAVLMETSAPPAPPSPTPEAQPAANTASAAPTMYTVVAGDYLSKIARDHGLDTSSGWRLLYDANEVIAHPDVILPGMQLRIPAPGEQIPQRQLPTPPPAPVSASSGSGAASSSPSSSSTSSSSSSSASAGGGVWDRLAMCESGGNWSSTVGTYDGGLQFLPSTWRAYGGGQYAPTAAQASKTEQIAVAERVLAGQGWGAWPACSSKLGLR